MANVMTRYAVESAVREQVQEAGLRLSGEAIDGLNFEIGRLVDQACKRAKANKRLTVMAHDFSAS